MNPQQTQQSYPQGDPTAKANNAAASLAFATHLQTQMMQHQHPPIAPETPQNVPGEAKDENSMNDTQEKGGMAKELTDFKTEIEGMIKSQIGDLKREIQTALAEEDNHETDGKETQTN